MQWLASEHHPWRSTGNTSVTLQNRASQKRIQLAHIHDALERNYTTDQPFSCLSMTH